MTNQFDKTSLSVLRKGFCAISIVLAGLLMIGCDAGPSGSSSAPATSEAKISGIVQDQHGPITDAKIEVRDKNGQLVTTTELSNGSNQYSVTIPAGTVYPILLTATPNNPEPGRDPVKAVVTSALADHIDITDVTTIVVDSAMTLGGLTEANIAKASGGAIGLRQRQGVSAAAGGGGAGPGQSGGGVSRGGHGGHAEHASSSGSGATSSDSSSNQQPPAQ
ncbi:hypothetical protein [Methylocaldum szegediense]|uniref:Carboxypeptidase regulatory-like domain-containing protein n=1 Tax=Methylocaldum szegediense TaxID=73780 RepID=A0ABM9I6S8_9GAMM|nr:hypothetical protein [Methylocaldum szegediense]CAI8928743.1 conserved protein of unknown function [Methylocaldum szegediense]